MIKVAFFDAKAYDKPSFEHYGSEHDMQFRFLETKLNEDTVELARGCDAVCVFVNDTVNAAVIDKLYAMGVKLIALRSAGYNNVDVQAAFGKIHVVHVPAYSPYAVAEHAIALLLTSVRRIHKAYNRTREFNFSLNGLTGFDFHGKTVGVIGTGKIGRIFIDICRGFGMKVIAYDRPVPNKPADFYVSFDNEGIGYAIAKSLTDHLKESGVPQDAGVLQINGSPTDAAAGLIRDGIHRGLKESGYKTLAEFDTPEWAPPKAQEWTAGQVTRFGDKIKGVVAANDGTGGGAIAAFKAAGVQPLPPVTGNDATIAALQLIIAGDQYNTISKPSEIVAAAAAKVAVDFIQGKKPQASTTLYNTPSQLFTPEVVTAKNIKAEIFDKKIQTWDQVCSGEYAAACQKLGISK